MSAVPEATVKEEPPDPMAALRSEAMRYVLDRAQAVQSRPRSSINHTSSAVPRSARALSNNKA